MKAQHASISEGQSKTAQHTRHGVYLTPAQCEQARLSRDRRFDGLFYTAVRSTGIYCRPVCPAPAAKAENVEYFDTAAAATAAGYRPCLRCRPELAPGADLHQRTQGMLRRALQRIEEGVLDEGRGASLAAELGISERHLRRLFQQELGVSPQQIALSRRLLFAKQLLHDSALPITQVALAAGFASLRRFNDAFQKVYGMNPRSLRKAAQATAGDANVLNLRLPYRPPYDFAAMLDFLRQRMIQGLEWADDQRYQRVLPGCAEPSWIEVWDLPHQHCLQLRLMHVPAAQILPVVRALRQLFDVDTDSALIDRQLSADEHLAPWVEAYPGTRVAGSVDGFELALRAVIGQQISVAAARTLLARVVQRAGGGLPLPISSELNCRFPAPEQVLATDLAGSGLTHTRVRTIQGVAEALLEGRVSLAPGQSLEGFVASWCQLPGIGPWTAHYLAMRVLHHPDAFPAADLILRRSAAQAVGAEQALSGVQLERLSQAWRPWRAYAARLLWRPAPV